MNLSRIILLNLFAVHLFSCADYNVKKMPHDKKYYRSTGFALVYEDIHYKQRIVEKKINNESLEVMHNILKKNTPIKIINPENSKFIETKISNKSPYPKIFNIVISKKISSILELDLNNPFVEIYEVKKNKTFVAKEISTYDEEKNVAEKAPVDEIKMDILTEEEIENNTNKSPKKLFIIVVADFYYSDSATNLQKEILKKIKLNKISVKKINNNKYRLLVGPFKNFNALKTSYISLNNLGFENLDIYKE